MNLKVEIRPLGSLEDQWECNKQIILPRGTLIYELLEKLTEQSPKLDLVNEFKKRRILILLNGTDLSCFQGLKTALNQDSEIVILPTVHGGIKKW